MLNQPMLRDVSIASQKKRRLLVTATYTIFVALLAVIAVKPSFLSEIGELGRQLLVIAVGLVPILFFYLTKLPIPGSSSIEMTRLNLTPGPRDPDDLDERQVVTRNAAHYQAFRFVLWYSLVVFIASVFMDDLNAATARRLMVTLTMLLFFVVWTLPQAIILWTEPDAPEEGRNDNP